jgi:hypothetical protein
MHEPNPFRRFRIEQFSSPGKKPVDADDVFHVVEQGNGSPVQARRALPVHLHTGWSSRVGRNESDHRAEAPGSACTYRESDDG